ncbi:hypothetical protein ACWDMR_02455 [Streptomyces althioticus]|jgi:hypothetical protein|uniref:Membrane protein n=1 Tax=Streptomyces griseorubens TaxID=66897 RepID=A0ABR4SWH6_9ACTN|nr:MULTISPECIES: hypothetical protein [Actinomycetes]ALV53111.1 hypothetical protein ASR50_29325 [Streptomyces sp. 4F]MCC9689203.1 hypothetical protein [Streptomyces sp. MNU103]WTC22099.1 hypothetical protein OG872_05250 [Streptomyces althioticus]GGT46631.1 hypothetical protein GCM10010243_25270 [Streptomyces matensis]KEG38982.1 membrane protein [Streptomyces griseorubens]
MSTTPLTAPARTGAPLRRLLALDAVVTGANALAYLALSGPLGRFLGIGSGLLLGLGAFLAVYAAGVGLLAARPHPPTAGVRGVVEANLAWTAASLLALALWLSPTTAGAVWVVLQALVVGGLALVQHQALKARQPSQV